MAFTRGKLKFNDDCGKKEELLSKVKLSPFLVRPTLNPREKEAGNGGSGIGARNTKDRRAAAAAAAACIYLRVSLCATAAAAPFHLSSLTPSVVWMSPFVNHSPGSNRGD